MIGEWMVGVFLRFTSNGVNEMTRITGATSAANATLARQQGIIDKNVLAMERYRAKIDSARLAHLRLAATASGVVALAGAAFSAYGLRSAAELQTAITSARINAPGMSAEQIRRIVMSVSSGTAQDATTIAKEFAVAASSGLTAGQLANTDIFKKFAYAADVLNLGPKHLDPTDTVKQLAQLSHLFGAYQGKPLDNMVESSVKMMSVQPEGLREMITQGRLFVRDALARGVSQDEIFRQYMLMGQVGLLRGRGGSGIENFMDRLQGVATLTSHMSKLQRLGLLDMNQAGQRAGIGGMYDAQGRLRFVDDKGNLHLEKAEQYLNILSKYMAKGEFANDIEYVFGKQGRNFALAASGDSTVHQMRLNQEKWKHIPSIQAQWEMYMNTFLGKWQYMTTNFKNVVIDIFTPLLPKFTHLFNELGGTFAHFDDWLGKNQGFAGAIGATILGLTTVSAALAGWFALAMARAAVTIPASAASIAASLNGLAMAMGTDAAAIGASGGTIATGATTAAGGLARLAGALGVLLGRVAPILALLSLSGDSGPKTDEQGRVWSNVYNRWMSAADLRSMEQMKRPVNDLVRDGRPAMFDQDRRARARALATQQLQRIHIDKVELHLPAGTPESHAHAILQHLSSIGGALKTSATLPGPLTIAPLQGST